MNRRGAILRASLVAVPLAAAMAAEPSAVGEWVTEGGKARVRIEPCAAEPAKLCGAITWSYQPEGAGPGPLVDVNNQDPALRSRPILGLPLLQGFEPDGPSAWGGGTIYDPEGGKTYRSKMRLDGPDRLEVEGCVLFVCRGQTWTRYRG
jgi:uncharacterized protein (DUF2147 family)